MLSSFSRHRGKGGLWCGGGGGGGGGGAGGGGGLVVASGSANANAFLT